MSGNDYRSNSWFVLDLRNRLASHFASHAGCGMVTMQRGDRDGLATGFGNDDMRRSTPRERPGWPVVVAGTIAVAVVLGPPLLLLRYREALSLIHI